MFSKIALLALALVPASLAQISTDFESGWNQTTWPIYAPDCNQGGAVSLDTTKAHSGKNSIKVAGAGGYCGHIFFGTTELPSGDLYVRTWLQASVALTSNHVSFITMPDSAQSGKHLRIGGQSQILMYNRETDDATLPDLSPDGIASSVALPTGSWQCLEYHIGTNGTIETWLNGVAIAGLTSIPGQETSINDQWQKSTIIPKPTGVYFGWESYGGDVNTFWYDDISIQSTRIGCGASTSTPTTISTVISSAPTSSVAVSSAPSSVTSAPVSSASSSAPAAPTSSTVVGTVPQYGQCGGQGWTGATACVAGYTCKAANPYYSQCL